MKAIHEYDLEQEHQAISVFYKLIALELVAWLPVITLLLHRVACIEQVMENDADKMLFRLECFFNEEKDQNLSGRNQRLFTVLTELPIWYFYVISNGYSWNPLEEPLQTFTARHGAITISECPDPRIGPAQLTHWLSQLDESLQAQDQNVLAS